ncbi:hypothetical protein L2E82_47000 [Cichorium intybus]|uniref:Uncharacterized protein n=1 Tax=Cichorium intybus TaxID=13427 RepID=A0ACB8YUV5_CICIN|nr:hypothetical protein L2E82_47000 [Cichorium intybus]
MNSDFNCKPPNIIGDYGPPLRTQSDDTFNHQDEQPFVRHVSVKLSDAENQSLGSSVLTLLIFDFTIDEDTEVMVQFSHNHGGFFQIEKNRVASLGFSLDRAQSMRVLGYNGETNTLRVIINRINGCEGLLKYKELDLL